MLVQLLFSGNNSYSENISTCFAVNEGEIQTPNRVLGQI